MKRWIPFLLILPLISMLSCDRSSPTEGDDQVATGRLLSHSGCVSQGIGAGERDLPSNMASVTWRYLAPSKPLSLELRHAT